jgi:dTDP-4-dehydrorhamnose reductase
MNDVGKKRVLVLGATGAIGHKFYQKLRERFETWGTVRCSYTHYAKYHFPDPEHIIEKIDALNFDNITEVIAKIQPDVIINCIGIIKQLAAAQDPIITIKLNSLFPHQLFNLCKIANARMIQLTTDCVFSGNKGMYTESDQSDATDLYGRTKFLGEVYQENCLTLRTSVIGRELHTTNGLAEWFMSRRGGKVKGYKNAIYSGFSSLVLAEIITEVIEKHPELSGLYQVSSEPIDKYSLLCLIRDSFGLDIEIEPDYEVNINRSLDSSKFRKTTGFKPPTWQQMIEELAKDPTPYDKWHETIK